MKLTDSQTKYLIGLQKKIKSLAAKQDALYQAACEQLKTEDKAGYLFDFLYNDTDLEDLENL